MVSLKRFAVVVVVLSVWLVAAGAQGPKQVVKLATLAPSGSVWYNELGQMGSDWRKVSGGRVDLALFTGGTQGDEDAVVRKMQFNQLQAASMTALGVAVIDEAFWVFTIPLFYESPDELFHVMDALTPTFEKRLEAKGFVLLSMGYAGWVQVFSRAPVATLADLRRMKVFTGVGDSKFVQWYKDNGFSPVPLASTDMLTALQTGQVDAVPVTPLAVLTMQWYSKAPYMLDLGLAPLPGAQIITTRAWQGLPADVRGPLKDAAQAAWKRLQAKVPESDRRAVTEMEKRGLKVTRIKDTPAAAPFAELAVSYAKSMRGKWVPPEVFDLVVKERDAYRARSGAKAAASKP